NKKTTPKILQIVFAICDPSYCQIVENRGAIEPAQVRLRIQNLRGGSLVRRMYTRGRSIWQSFLQP
ncbi:MAG TPA: hypothetical protein VGD38_08400, partial [Pyrinomonadaceae bacterium]